jgi:hypothetical protein
MTAINVENRAGTRKYVHDVYKTTLTTNKTYESCAQELDL